MTKILAITGGVGGAKLALGLSQVLDPDEVLFAVNTGDDFEHLGLNISPDIDSLTYALAQVNNDELGWGRAGETWQFIDTLGSLGGEDWFRLGDQDLALHIHRTELLKSGMNLTEATANICTALGIRHALAPMSDQTVSTIVHSDQGDLAFQHYFVRDRCQPMVKGFTFEGIESAQLNPKITEWLTDCDGVIICPSNPYVSVDPLLKLGAFREALRSIPTIAVSPIVGGLAIKGPAAKMMTELKVPSTALAVGEHYGDLLDGYVIDNTDADDQSNIHNALGIPTIVTNTIMVTLADRVSLAKDALRLLHEIAAV